MITACKIVSMARFVVKGRRRERNLWSDPAVGSEALSLIETLTILLAQSVKRGDGVVWSGTREHL